MTITTARSRRRILRPRSNQRSAAAFSLVEVVVVMSMMTMILTALFSSWGFIGRSTLGISHYTELNSMGRTGLEIFARDIRRARDIEEGFSSSGMTLIMVNDDNTSSPVKYEYEAATKRLVRRDGSSATAVFEDVEQLQLSYFQTERDPMTDEVLFATNSLDARLVQLELRMARQVQGRDTTQNIISARYIMRNKPHGQ